jgi:hypothetical protein
MHEERLMTICCSVRAGRVMKMAVEDLLGADVETGGVWDPLVSACDAA